MFDRILTILAMFSLYVTGLLPQLFALKYSTGFLHEALGSAGLVLSLVFYHLTTIVVMHYLLTHRRPKVVDQMR